MTEFARINIGVDDKGVALMTKVLPKLTAETAKAEAAAKRFTDANGKLREANGRFVKTTTDAATATDRAGRAAAKAGGDFKKMENAAQKATNTIRNLAGALGVGLTLREVANLSDAYTTMVARLRLVTTSEQQRVAVQRDLNGVASRTRADVTATTELYVKLRQANEGLGYTTKQTTDLTEAFGLALKASGASGATATSAIQQFGQAMSKGALTGDEFVTISEAAPEVLRLLQKELGVSRARLLEMREAGELTGRMIADALVKNLETLRGQVGTAPKTIADGFTALRNSVIKTIGASNDMATAAKNIAEGLERTGKFLEDNGPILLQLGKLAVGAYAGVKAVNALRAALVAVNGVSLASLAGRLGPLVALLAPFAGFVAKGLRDASDAQDRAREVDRLAALPANERDTLAAGTVASLTAVDRRRVEVAKLRQTENSEALAREEQLLNIRRNELVELQQRIRDAGGFAQAVAETATASTSGKSAAEIAKEARKRMLDALEAAGKEIADGIAIRDTQREIRLREAVRSLPLIGGTQGTGGVPGDDRVIAKAVQAGERAADQVQSIMTALASGLQNTFSNGLQDLFTNGLSSVDRFARSLRDTILRAFSDILASRITASLLNTLSSLGGGGGRSASLASGGGSLLGSLGSLGALKGIGGGSKIANISKAGGGSKIANISKAGGGFSFGGALASGGAGFLLGNAIGARNGSGAGAIGGAASGAATGALIGSIVPGLGTVVGGVIGGAVIGGAAGLLGGLFGGNSRKKKQQEAARQLAADAAAFSDDLIARTLEASGDVAGAQKKRLETQQAAERAAAAAKFGKTSKAYRDLLDAQAAERAAQDASSNELGAGTYLAPNGFNANAYRFDAGRPTTTSAPVVTGNQITIVVPDGTTAEQAQRILAEFERISRAQGLPPNTLPTGSLT